MKSKVFEGLSTPDDLKKMWVELKKDNDPNLLNVIWDYTNPKQLKHGFNIVNIKYDPDEPDEVGHYCLIMVNDRTKKAEYFNPVAKRTVDDIDKLKDLNDYFVDNDYEVDVDLTGKQKIGSEDCGYHCLTHAFNNMDFIKSSGVLSPNASISEKLDDIIKLLRGIYYTSKPKKVGKGLADFVPDNKRKNVEYPELKKMVRDYLYK